MLAYFEDAGSDGHAVEIPLWTCRSNPGGRLPRRRILKKFARSFFILRLLGRRTKMLLPLLNVRFASALCCCFFSFFCVFFHSFCCFRLAGNAVADDGDGDG